MTLMRSFYFFFVKYIKKVLTCTTESYNCNFKNKHNKKTNTNDKQC